MSNLREEFQAILDRLEKTIDEQQVKEDHGWNMKCRAKEDIDKISRSLSDAKRMLREGEQIIAVAEAELKILNNEADVIRRAMDSTCFGGDDEGG